MPFAMGPPPTFFYPVYLCCAAGILSFIIWSMKQYRLDNLWLQALFLVLFYTFLSMVFLIGAVVLSAFAAAIGNYAHGFYTFAMVSMLCIYTGHKLKKHSQWGAVILQIEGIH